MVETDFRVKSTEFHTPTLKCFENGGEFSSSSVSEFNKEYFNLSDEEANIKTKNGDEAKYINYTRNALYDLNHSPFLKKSNGKYKITKYGLKFLRKNPGSDVFKILNNYITYRHYKRLPMIFESKFHILSIDLFVSSKFSTIEKGNEIIFEYLFEEDMNLEEIKQDDLILGYDKHDCCFKYLFKILDVSHNRFNLKKIFEVSEGFKINDSFLIKALDVETICSIYYDEFKFFYSNMIDTIRLVNEFDGNLEDYDNFKRNKIYFGAPGTGKSYKLEKDKKCLLEHFPDNFERVTFHPDYSYASFVGTYKPIPKEDNEDVITYDYVPGPFIRVLSKALINKDEPFLLIIEEINRANVAAVFGDIFQLLDRNKNFISEYPIDTSKEMRKHLSKVTKKPEDDFEKICIPKNMFIWATMNSADQGVFFMDTAFKRRWDFEYVDINNEYEKIKDKVFISNNEKVYWDSLRQSINNYLLKKNINEDKCIGPFFISSVVENDDNELDDKFLDDFKNKLLMYLFEDAAKSQRDKIFDCSKVLTYSNICEDFNNKGIHVFVPEIANEVKTEKLKDKNETDTE